MGRSLLRRLGFVVAALACGGAPVAWAQKEYTPIPGSRVSLIVPAGFEIADEFSGVVRRDARASIEIVETPVGEADRYASFTREALASGGISLERTEEARTAIGRAKIFHATRQIGSTPMRQWMLLAGNTARSVLITAMAPATSPESLVATLRYTLLTARWDPERVVDPYAGLGFALRDTGDFAVSQSIMGSAVFLTPGGHRSSDAPGAPVLMATRSFRNEKRYDLFAVSQQFLAQTEGLREATITDGLSLQVDGLDAHELVASAQPIAGEPITIYQLVTHDGTHYYVIQAQVAAREAKRYLQRFRDIAHSFDSTAADAKPKGD